MTYLLLLHCFAYDESEDLMTELKTITRKTRHGVKRLRKKYIARNEQWRAIQGELRDKKKGGDPQGQVNQVYQLARVQNEHHPMRNVSHSRQCHLQILPMRSLGQTSLR